MLLLGGVAVFSYVLLGFCFEKQRQLFTLSFAFCFVYYYYYCLFVFFLRGRSAPSLPRLLLCFSISLSFARVCEGGALRIGYRLLP